MTFKRVILAVLLMSLFLPLGTSGCSARNNAPRPNFLIIVTDDQRYDTMQYMPNTQAGIFDQGVTFSKGFITTPFCCPSRSSIFTGMYAHNHLVEQNSDPLNIETVMAALHADGYYTGLIGKYLNSWAGEQKPEFDYWVTFASGQSKYKDPELNVNGTWNMHPGYITYILSDYAIEFLEKTSKQSKPFMLVFTPNAPHTPTTPAEEDLPLYDQLPEYSVPSMNEEDLSDKPASIQKKPILNADELAALDDIRRRQILTLVALDRKIGEILAKLKETGQLDNTVIIFLSDNGLHWGEHRMDAKNTFYEESVRVPFAMRYPALVPTPYVENRLVANIDIAPTMYQLAGLSIPYRVDGTSLVNLFDANKKWRDHILLEAWPPRGVWAAVRTDRYVYGETENDLSEFYDLQLDPYELENQINNPAYMDIIAKMKKQLEKDKKPKFFPSRLFN
jgi:arylsulfatase A-like enzyme